MPAPSWPSTDGAFHGMVPSMTDRSEWQTPAATIFTFTWVGPGSRTSNLSVTTASSPVYTMPRIRFLSVESQRYVGSGDVCSRAKRARNSVLSTLPLALTGRASIISR